MNKLKDIVLNIASADADKTAIIFDDFKINYNDLDKLISQSVVYLSNNGVRAGHEVLLMMDNSVEFVVLLLALFRLEAVAFLLPPSLKPDEFLGVTKNNKIDVSLVLSESLPEVIDLVKAKSLKVFSCYYDGLINFKLVDGGNVQLSLSKEHIYALRMISSGSTGSVKQMLRTSDSLMLMCEAVKEAFGLNRKDVLLNFVPPVHIMGVGQIVLAIYLHATLLVEKTFIPSKILADIEKYQATWMMASPFVLDVLALSADPQKNNLSSMRLAISSSSPLSERTYYNFRSKCGIPLSEVYGSTECTIVTAELDDGVFKPNVVGKPVQGVEVKIVNDNFQEVLVGEVGNVATLSPIAVTEYQNNPEANKETFIDGFVLVGDRGFVDELGQLHVIGRSNDVINVAGKKVDPVEVEQVLLNHSAVKDVAVYGVDKDSTQVVKAAVVKASEVDSNELIVYCQQKLSDYKLPREIKFVDQLPRNKTGKLMRQQLISEG